MKWSNCLEKVIFSFFICRIAKLQLVGSLAKPSQLDIAWRQIIVEEEKAHAECISDFSLTHVSRWTDTHAHQSLGMLFVLCDQTSHSEFQLHGIRESKSVTFLKGSQWPSPAPKLSRDIHMWYTLAIYWNSADGWSSWSGLNRVDSNRANQKRIRNKNCFCFVMCPSFACIMPEQIVFVVVLPSGGFKMRNCVAIHVDDVWVCVTTKWCSIIRRTGTYNQSPK